MLDQKSRPPKWKPGLHIIQGRQVVKGYSVTEDQLETLTTLGVGAAAFFSIATGLLGFAFNLKATIDLTTGVLATTVNFWTGVEFACFIGSVLSGIGGLILALRRWWKTSAIKAATKFEGDS